jgi:RND family efflux transporter MFP subunit
LARFEVLVAQQAATQQEFDGIKARAAAAEAALNEAETYLSYGAIVAPFSGTVVGKAVDVGDQAMPGKPLFTIEQTGAALFVTTLPESKLGQITAGDSLSVSIGSQATVRGKVEELSPSTDPMSHTFMLKLSLPSTPGISPGQFGRLLLPAGEDETIFIPRAGLVRRGQLDLVYVVSAENRAMLRLVRIGRQFPDRLEILSGLRESEKVVVSDQRDLSDGDLVREVS